MINSLITCYSSLVLLESPLTMTEFEQDLSRQDIVRIKILEAYSLATGTSVPAELLKLIYRDGIKMKLWNREDISQPPVRTVPDDPDSSPLTQPIDWEGFHYDPLPRKVITPTGLQSNLTPSEHRIFYHFIKHPREITTYRQILRALEGGYTMDQYGHSNMKSHVSHLRGKIGDECLNRDRRHFLYIQPIFGVGYSLDPVEVSIPV